MSKLNKDSVLGTFVVIVTFCLVCSVIVSSAVVLLDPFKTAAVANDRQVNILKVSGFEVEGSVAKTFSAHIESHLIDVETGALADSAVPADQIEGYNFASLAKKPESSVAIAKDQDVAKILSHAKYMPVYFAKDEQGQVQRVILPFYGQALWSTVFGYVALAPKDGNTIKAAELLFVHRNTVKYRLGQAEAILGCSLSDAGVRLKVQLALYIRSQEQDNGKKV